MEKKLQNFITRSSFLRIISLAIVVVFLSSLTNVSGQGSKANFSGNWTLNESKSTLPQGGGGGGMRSGTTFVVTQDANILTRTSTGQDGTKRETKYNLDGKESVNTSARGDSKSIAKWSADGKSLTINTTRTTDNGEMKSTETWSMTDAKTLSINSVSPGRDGGERKATMVYDKK
jgi:hypothetical protein